MKSLISRAMILTFAVIMVGCAASYKQINPPTLNYNSHDIQDGVSLSYQYDILSIRGNKKYARKEDKNGVKLIAVKVTNNTDSTINIGHDVIFYSNQKQLFPMQPLAVKESIKQIVPGYIPYLLLSFLQLNITKGDPYDGYTTESYPIGLAIGPGITIGNMVMASSSNKNMLAELLKYDILNKNIKKGETIYGIIGLHETGYSPITVKLKGR